MTPILSLQGISKRFGAVVIADAIDLDVGEGESLGVLGPNGAGKTTVFGIIAGSVQPDAGRVSYQGRDITGLRPEQRARAGLARSFQVPQPFGGLTVFENLLVPASFARKLGEADAYELAAATLVSCDLAHRANERAGSLRLLDRKRLELARALASRPRLLLLDEVAGGLSEAECEELVGLIRRVRATGVSIIWIEHIMHALFAVVDRVVVLAGGALIASGTPGDVVADPKVAEIYMGIAANE